MNFDEIVNSMMHEDAEIISERIVDRARGNVAGAGAAGKYLWNRISGHKDRNKGSFRDNMRNARFAGTIKSHARVVNGLVQQMNQFIAQQNEAGKDTSELESISSGITDFFRRNEKIFGLGLGDANAEDYKNQELPQQNEAQPPEPSGAKAQEPASGEASPKQPEQPEQPEQPQASAPQEESPQANGEANAVQQPQKSGNPFMGKSLEELYPQYFNRNKGRRSQQGKQAPATPTGSGRQVQSQRPQAQHAPMPKKKKNGFWTDNNVWLNARHESTSLDCLYGQMLLREQTDDCSQNNVSISSLYNKILISEAQVQPNQQLPQDVNNAIVQVYSKLGDLADSGTEEDKDFVYQLIQKISQGTPMQDILRELEARGQQEKQQAQSQEGVNEGFDDWRRKYYARKAGKEAAKSGGDRKAAQQEAYDNRIFEFQTRLDRALGELSLDLKTMGYKQQGGDADRLISAFRKAVSQFSKSKKEEGETSWLQRRRHGLGHALATSATYAALRAVCPATILGNKYFARGLYGAATSVIRDVSRGNLNKKSILRALAGAGLAVGATIGGEMLKPSLVTNINREDYMVNGNIYGKKTISTNPGNLGTRVRSWFDKDLRGQFGTSTSEWGNPAVKAAYGGATTAPTDNMVDSVDTGVKKVKSLISDGSIDPDDKLVSLKGDNGRSYLYNKDLDEVYASDGSQVSLKTAIGQEIKNKAGDMDGVAAKDFGSGATTAASAPPVAPPSDAMPDNVKDALGHTDEGELDLEQTPANRPPVPRTPDPLNPGKGLVPRGSRIQQLRAAAMQRRAAVGNSIRKGMGN